MKTPIKFSLVIARINSLKKSHWDECDRLTKHVNNAVLAEYKRHFPKRKADILKARKAFPEVHKVQFEAAKAWLDAFDKENRAKIERLERVAVCRAIKEPIQIDGKAWHLVDSEDGGAHHTQGFGADHYAKDYLEGRAESLDAAGIPFKITQTWNKRPEFPGDHYVRTSNFELWAPVTKEGYQHARTRPGLSLVERVRRCWARGCQPRVRMWWLPYDFEEKNGLDYHGNYVKKTA